MDFGLQSHVSNTSHQPHFTIPTGEPAKFEAWQMTVRDALRKSLGIDGRIPTAAPQAERLTEQDMGSYTETKYRVLFDDVAIPMFILTPNTAPPYRAVLAFHGHGPGVSQISGHYPDDETRTRMLANDENFAQRLAEDGFLVCAIEQQGFGERVTSVVSDFGNSCHHLATNYLMQGRTLLGERVREGIAALNYVVTVEDVDTSNIGCVGFSGGGATALFLSALEQRIASTVVAGYFCDFRASIMAMRHCTCNYVPGLLTQANIETIAAAIAPRRLRLMNGENDPIFPQSGFHEPYRALQKAYEIAGRPGNLSAELYPGGHQFKYAPAYQWLNYR